MRPTTRDHKKTNLQFSRFELNTCTDFSYIRATKLFGWKIRRFDCRCKRIIMIKQKSSCAKNVNQCRDYDIMPPYRRWVSGGLPPWNFKMINVEWCVLKSFTHKTVKVHTNRWTYSLWKKSSCAYVCQLLVECRYVVRPGNQYHLHFYNFLINHLLINHQQLILIRNHKNLLQLRFQNCINDEWLIKCLEVLKLQHVHDTCLFS